MLKAAQQAAISLVANLQAQQLKKEEEWRIKEAQIKVTHKEKGIAYIPIRLKGTELKILLSDQSWKKIQARSACCYGVSAPAGAITPLEAIGPTRWGYRDRCGIALVPADPPRNCLHWVVR